MKTNTPTQRRRSGFTLIEMIGVLAIIAVLAALLIPRIFSAINDSRINSAAMSYNSLKSAAMSYFGKYGRFGNATGGALDLSQTGDQTIAADWGKVLLSSGFTEKPFETKLSDTHVVHLAAPTGNLTTADSVAFDLDGDGTVDTTSAQYVIEATLENVTADDALALSQAIDGKDLSATSATVADAKGRVRYLVPANGVAAKVHLYLAHK